PPSNCSLMRTHICTVLWLMAGLSHSTAAESATSSSALFNGTNLIGFYSWLVDTHYQDPRHVFTVTNRMIRISGEGLGYLATSNDFENFHLVAEFKWGERNWRWG